MRDFITKTYEADYEFIEGFDNAIIGFAMQEKKVVYSLSHCIDIYMQTENIDNFDVAFIKLIFFFNSIYKDKLSRMPVMCIDFIK